MFYLFIFAGVTWKGLNIPFHIRGQFLKAPTLLALLMKFFRRSWSISANPEVCVTTVRWFIQNLKQNSSKSWNNSNSLMTLYPQCKAPRQEASSQKKDLTASRRELLAQQYSYSNYIATISSCFESVINRKVRWPGPASSLSFREKYPGIDTFPGNSACQAFIPLSIFVKSVVLLAFSNASACEEFGKGRHEDNRHARNPVISTLYCFSAWQQMQWAHFITLHLQ